MPLRNRHRIGDYLIVDDESGLTIYASQARKLWDGTMRHFKSYETRHPQEFVRAKSDPKPLMDVRPRPASPLPFNGDLIFVGNTTVPAPVGPATHLYDVGIGEMVVGQSFLVR